ncbi:MAG: Xaa-Pro peptidase family protein [Actinomycetota bacterium]|nr:Xaa-Pro peptidase family protein [Actinomycetota bacterium]
MTDLLIWADTLRSPEMRHEVPVVVPDAFLYLERGGERHVVITPFEVERVQGHDGLQPHAVEEFGWDDLVKQGVPMEEVQLGTAVRAVKEFGIEKAVVPTTFPIELADRLRAEGIEITPDRETFVQRRRVKTAAELEGIKRAQHGAEAGMDAACELFRRAKEKDGSLVLDGEPLTCERVKIAIQQAFTGLNLLCDEFIVSHGEQTAIGHEMGSGEIKPNEPIVLDLWPRDRESSCYADMTRTFVIGEPSEELVTYQGLVYEALQRSLAAVKPGVPGRDVYVVASEVFHEAGYPTGLHKRDGEVLEDGFFHGLGHGVGLEVHEQPWLSRYPGELVAGDVITLEPGLYRSGYGGCRLEDLVLVTKDGVEVLTDYPYDLEL